MRQITFILFLASLSACNTNNTTMNEIDSKTAYEISKTFPVSRDKVYAALTDSTVIKKIWGVQSIHVDARVGGETKAVFIEGGNDWSFTITYNEVIPNEKLKWITHFKSFPNKETRVTLLFKKADEGTEFVIRMENFENEEERNANKGAWEHGLTVLDSILK